MCGIPMPEPHDAVIGARLTARQAFEHIGGLERFFTDDGRRMIARHAKDYIWKYPGHGYCTACGQDVGDVRARHGTEMPCPNCGKAVQFRHEARGHSRVFDQFCLYEWRKSVLDPQTIILTAAHIWRDSTRDRPERSPRRDKPTAIYVFRPGRAVTVYKDHRWGSDSADPDEWYRVDSVGADHTGYQSGQMDVAMSYGQFREALRGTRIGATFDALNDASTYRETLELTAIASCARRPWLEYIAKAGQPRLAADLMRMNHVPSNIVPRQRAKTPRELLGLTEAQWHEVRRDNIRLNTDVLRTINALRRAGLGDMHMDRIMAINHHITGYCVELLAPSRHRRRYEQPTIGDLLARAPIPDRLRRKALRRILNEPNSVIEWRDYYDQLTRLGEDMGNTALLLPRDMHAMHQRMIQRERVLKEEAEIKALEAKGKSFAKLLKKLKKGYTFAACGLVLRPFESGREVVDEGKALNICIGSYAERYLEGNTILCCLRRAEAPDVPWRAVEFSSATGKLVQDRGYKNDMGQTIPPADREKIDGFWRAWNERKERKTA